MPTAKKQAKVSTEPPKTTQQFPIVGVGASAGGLSAFKRLLTSIPENSGMAYVLVQHLHPSHESILPDILQRATKIPVHEITDDIHLAPNHIYVIPSSKILTSVDGVLSISPRKDFKTNLLIDVFFKSLGEVHKELAAGVVLSGTGSDGTIGLKAIKEYGGITIAQDEESAEFNDMPQHAIAAGVVDFILPPEEIPAQLLKISSNFPKENKDGDAEPLPEDDEAILKQILLLLHQRSGIDFTYYKQSTIRRRIARRIGMCRKENLPGYLEFLRSDTGEQDALFQDMLIPVTAFFRDPKTFDTLCNRIFPVLFKDRSADEPIRIWIAGCSTGEEVYSIAICLHEFLGEKAATIPIQIFASDISKIAIKKARAGSYSKADVQVLSATRLQDYFRKADGRYEVNKVIRDMCVFAPHNFLQDPPFAKIDLISCRNVLIYLDIFLQKKALTTFHYSLKQNGYLLLGKSETASAGADLFTLHDKQHKIYSRKPVPGRFIHVATERSEETLAIKNANNSGTGKIAHLAQPFQTDFKKSGEAILLSKYTPAAVIVNKQMDIVHIHGAITTFLEPPPGKPTFNLLKMAREGLEFELRNALHKATTTNAPVIKDGIPSKQNDKEHLVRIEVVPLTKTVEPYFLILFSKTELPLSISSGKDSLELGKTKKYAEAKHRIIQLEKDLSQVREDMRGISQEQEAANEELQSGNEELQSSNEEMQSLNEELETSKEELQSSNEELIIVNQELLDKHEQLNAARLYSDSIITTMRNPLIVLDRDLRIKTANASFYKKFNTTEDATEGKLFYEIQDRQWDNYAMRALLEKVLPEKRQITDFEICLTFPLLGERTLLLNGLQIINEASAQSLILIAIEDITERRSEDKRLHLFTEQLEDKVEERTLQLVNKNAELTAFNYISSHDLQEPLRKIQTFASLILQKEKEQFSESSQNYFSRIISAAARMQLLINALLNYANADSGETNFVSTDLNKVLHEVKENLYQVIKENNAVIETETLPVLNAIPLQMNQLFSNLISNAIKYRKEDVLPVIQITATKRDASEIKEGIHLPGKQYWEITIADNGIGFEPAYGTKIFELFQRLHSTAEYGGAGLGLAICKKIAENHHGNITAQSKLGEGAVFTIYLPLTN